MKKLLVSVIVVAGLVSGAFAIPSGYKNIDSSTRGVDTYMSNNGKIAVIEAVTKKSDIKFGIGDEGATNKYGHRTFRRQSIVTHYDNNDAGKLYMALNGQFFGWSKYTPLSFNVKKDGDLLQDKILEPEKGKRVMAIYKGVYPVFYKGFPKFKNGKQTNKEEIQKTILKILKNKNFRDGITGFDPFDKNAQNAIGATRNKGRNMIGCIPYPKYDKGGIAICKKVYFFIAKSISQPSLIKEMKKWGVKEDYMITLDGSGSAQAFSRDFDYNNRDFRMYGDGRFFPNSILIYSK